MPWLPREQSLPPVWPETTHALARGHTTFCDAIFCYVRLFMPYPGASFLHDKGKIWLSKGENSCWVLSFSFKGGGGVDPDGLSANASENFTFRYICPAVAIWFLAHDASEKFCEIANRSCGTSFPDGRLHLPILAWQNYSRAQPHLSANCWDFLLGV